ncbi:MAG: cellulase family glycosylhydrolase [Anaerolineae bacterium]|nr:cellulase family glycosylhydrolase [Anaerolineae bacterium]
MQIQELMQWKITRPLCYLKHKIIVVVASLFISLILFILFLRGSVASTCVIDPFACVPDRAPTHLANESTRVSAPDKWSLWTEGTQLRGANVYQRRVYPAIDGLDVIGPGPVGPVYTQEDFDRLAALGANYVNISHPGLFTETAPYTVALEIQTHLDNLLDMIAQANMFAVISFRTGPGRSEFTFMWDEAGTWFDESYLDDSVWQDAEAQNAWVAMWRYTAQRYRDNPIVVGYDLMVEPNSNEVGSSVITDLLDIWEPTEFYSMYGGTLYDWNQLYPRITTAIREVDSDTPILIGGLGYSGIEWLPYLNPTGDARTVYMFHQYAPTQYTHQGSDDITCAYPGTCDLDRDGEVDDTFNRAWLDGLLSTVNTFTTTYSVPVAVNEFGLMRWEPGGDAFMDDQMDLLEQRGLNHALWMWDPSWVTWTQHLNAFNFRFGPDPENLTDVPTNALQTVIVEHWEQNTARPSSTIITSTLYLPLILRTYTTVVSPTCLSPLTGVTISGPASGVTGTTYTFNAVHAPTGATPPIAYIWSPAPQRGQSLTSACYQWNTIGAYTVQVTASNCEGTHSADATHVISIHGQPSGDLVQPGDLTYLGAFRLPGGDTKPETFAYGGNAMTFNPNGNSGAVSLFITGHDRQPYGELPNGSQVAEVNIPTPSTADNVTDLPQATFLQGFHDVAAGLFTEFDYLPRIGMAYLDVSATGPKIHLAWGAHYVPETPLATHAWFDPNLAAPDVQGTWFIGDQRFYSVNGYMFEIPTSWADMYAEGRYLATGRMRDGGLGGMGPSLFAYRPWTNNTGTPALSGTHLTETVLLLYENAEDTEIIEHCLNGYQHPDEWEGGAWVTTQSGKSAVLFAGTKSTGAKYWYGFINPAGAEYPCVHEASVGEFLACRMADGSSCPPEDFTSCCDEDAGTCVSYRGWWSTRFDAQLLLYDPAELAQVAAGAIASWEPQPYAFLDIDDYLFLDPPESELEDVGTGLQRRYRILAAAYDRNNDLLYVLERYADEAKPVVHVWHIE